MRTLRSNLAYGVYLGKSEVRRELPGFSVAVLQPTFHAEDVAVHTHDSASLIFVLEGSYRTSADGANRISSGPLLIFNPAGTTHKDSFVVPSGRFLALSLSDEVTRIANDGGYLPKTAVAFSAGEPLLAVRRLMRAFDSGDAPVLEDLCWEVLGSLTGASLWANPGAGGQPLWLNRARALLNDRGAVATPMTGIAGELGIHPVYLARSFRKHLRCSPAEYRTRCRLQRAMDLLCRGEESLGNIALDAGFFDQSHFTTAFRQQFGHAPGAYRRKLSELHAEPGQV